MQLSENFRLKKSTEDAELKKELKILQENSDNAFIIFSGMFVLLMQCGFAFLEAGSVRKKNTVNILIKNILDLFIGSIAFWAFGYGFAYGEPSNGLIGHNYFFSMNVEIFPTKEINYNDPTNIKQSGESYFANWFFQYVYAATAATIVSGAVAERVQFVCYVIYSFTITSFIYPVSAHWVWADTGWLHTGAGTGLRMLDFAGSSVVHVCGGVAALIGAKILGPRLNRFSPEGEAIPIRGHSIPLVALGAFLLYLGFLCFNGGSMQSISRKGDTNEAALAIMNTLICGSFGGLMAMLTNRIYSNCKGKSIYWSLLTTINGGLTGMVASCAGCNDFEPWSAMVIGTIAGIVFAFSHVLILQLQIDDPLDAISVHIGGGAVGTLLTPIFALRGQKVNGNYVGGIIYSNHPIAYQSLAWNLLGLLAVAIWSGLCCFIIFYTMSLTGLIRISKNTELKGIDATKHGELAYPEDVETVQRDAAPKSANRRKKSLSISSRSIRSEENIPNTTT